MQPKTNPSNETLLNLNIRRVFPGTREEIFRAWTDPIELAKWWWPSGWETVYEIDLRVGGTYRFYTSKATGLGSLAVGGIYLEINAPERLVYTWQFEGEPETRVTVTFTELPSDTGQSQTEITILHEGFADSAQLENHAMGWHSCLDRFAPAVTGSSI